MYDYKFSTDESLFDYLKTCSSLAKKFFTWLCVINFFFLFRFSFNFLLLSRMEGGQGEVPPPLTPKRVYGNARSVDNSPLRTPGSVNFQKTPKSSGSASLQDTPQTPKSANSRSCWVFQSYKVGNSYSFEISVKNHSGRTGPLSVCKPAAKYRPSFGSIVNVPRSNC